jgi:hypothetical protein
MGFLRMAGSDKWLVMNCNFVISFQAGMHSKIKFLYSE